jgi:putative pyruvate formate lyase activating enzyme
MATILDLIVKLDKRGYERPIIWNSNNYMTEQSLGLLTGVADLHLADFKYGNNECAEELSGIKNYREVITRNLKAERGVADILIRHLVLPGHVECCTSKVIEWCSENIPDAGFNLMFQYHPEYHAFEHPVINRYLSSREIDRAIELKNEAGLY